MHMKVLYICVNFNLINKALQYIYKKYSLLFTFFFLFSLISNSQTKTPVFTQHDLKVKKNDSTIHFGKVVLYDDLSAEWIESEKSIILVKKDSIRELLKSKIQNSEIFNTNWSNSRLFPYPDQTFHLMEDSIKINLLEESSFYMLPNEHLFSPFGWRRNRQHKGMDLDLDTGDTLRAAFSGKVRFSKYNNGGYGYLVIIRHFSGLETYYAHLDKLLVQPNDIVLAGDVIGLGGETGNALGPHLHFEIRYKDVAFNPANIIDFDSNNVKYINNGVDPIYYLTKEDFKWVSAASKKKYYKLKKGEYLGIVAQKHNISIKKILKLNPSIKETDILQIGKIIRVR